MRGRFFYDPVTALGPEELSLLPHGRALGVSLYFRTTASSMQPTGKAFKLCWPWVLVPAVRPTLRLGSMSLPVQNIFCSAWQVANFD